MGLPVLIVVALLLGLAHAVSAAADRQEVRVQGVAIRIGVRTADQINAFYEARGFPLPALKVLSSHCFIGVSMRNESDNVVWLERSRFRFRAPGTREEWQARPLDFWLDSWRRLAIPASARAAFRWTQLPETRDLQPNEPVGGNLSFPRRSGQFDLEVRLATGQDRHGPPLLAHFRDLSCP